MTLKIGQTLQDRYRIVSLLGKGGMAAVYKAKHMQLNVAVAVKEMIPQPGLDSQTLAYLRQQFRQEARILARLDHPHLVRVSDFFEERDNAYLVMDFVEGESLAERIEREGALSEEETLTWAGQLLNALSYCHAQGIIHRDVKPQNVIIRSDGRAVLVDFGLVKLWDPNDPRTKTQMRGMGTPEYAPPEQYSARLGHTNPRSDIYSLGATLYHALTGEAPMTATDRIAAPDQFRPVRELNPGVDPRIEAAVLRAMEMNLYARFATAHEMAEALAAPVYVEDGVRAPVQRHPRTQVMPEARVRKGVPPWAWALGGLVSLTLVAGLAMVIGWGSGFPFAGATPSPTPTLTLTSPPTSTREPTDVPTDTPMPTATKTPRPTSTPVGTSVAPVTQPSPTAMPESPSPTATRRPIMPTATSAPSVAPQPAAPAMGGEYKSPVTFEWSGSLESGQLYQVMAYHPGSGHVIQSAPLAETSWTVDLPGDKYGEWRWSVSVVQDGRAIATSGEWMFWFNPHPGGGGGGGDRGATPTPA